MSTYGSDFATLDFNFDCEDPVPCLLCDELFTVMKDNQPLLQHLLSVHKFVIGDVEQVADLRQYILYWGKLRHLDLLDYCVVFRTNSEPGTREPSETFYLLCSKLPEDGNLRQALGQMKLKCIVSQKEKERNDVGFSRKCIYCSETVVGGVTKCFHHLAFHHGFSLGNPDNIVYGAQLLDILQEKLQNLQCLFCEKIFRTHKILREHMRKQQHRYLNPKNKIYDKFYLRNYLRPGTPWEEAKRDLDEESDTESYSGGQGGSNQEDLLWTDWHEDVTPPTTCLFCPFTTIKVPTGLLQHMRGHHNFDFENATRNYNFYQKVKIVNFIRSCVVECRCPRCELVFAAAEALQRHMLESDHCKLPRVAVWDLPRYHFPVVENDGLLCFFEDSEPGSCSKLVDEVIVPEDSSSLCTNSILNDSRLRHEINGTESGDVDGAVMCLFCRYTASGDLAHVQVFSHMRALHCFDFTEVTAKSECYVCEQVYSRTDTMEEHRVLANHITLPDYKLFEDKWWLHPVLEGDGLLQRLREAGDSDDEDPSNPNSSQEQIVFSEDIHLPSSILSDEAVRRELFENMTSQVSESATPYEL